MGGQVFIYLIINHDLISCDLLEKLPDVCYSWWVLASLAMLGRLHWIDKQKMVSFILACQVSVACRILQIEGK